MTVKLQTHHSSNTFNKLFTKPQNSIPQVPKIPLPGITNSQTVFQRKLKKKKDKKETNYVMDTTLQHIGLMVV